MASRTATLDWTLSPMGALQNLCLPASQRTRRLPIGLGFKGYWTDSPTSRAQHLTTHNHAKDAADIKASAAERKTTQQVQRVFCLKVLPCISLKTTTPMITESSKLAVPKSVPTALETTGVPTKKRKYPVPTHVPAKAFHRNALGRSAVARK